MTVIRIKVCRQTGPYGRVPQNRFWFVPNYEQGIPVGRVAIQLIYVDEKCLLYFIKRFKLFKVACFYSK